MEDYEKKWKEVKKKLSNAGKKGAIGLWSKMTPEERVERGVKQSKAMKLYWKNKKNNDKE